MFVHYWGHVCAILQYCNIMNDVLVQVAKTRLTVNAPCVLVVVTLHWFTIGLFGSKHCFPTVALLWIRNVEKSLILGNCRSD